MLYLQLLGLLNENADVAYRTFHKKLLKNESINVLGVRVPVLRNIAKLFKDDVEGLLAFPDEYYEVTFIKLIAVSNLKYEQFVKYVDLCVSLIDNWAICDCFKVGCIQGHKEQFLPFIEKYISVDKEYYQRFALVTLLYFYIDDDSFDYLITAISKADKSYYYVHMAVAWLFAEMLVKNFNRAFLYLSQNYTAAKSGNGFLDKATHNKTIQKAKESFCITQEQKNILNGIKL